MPSRRCAYVTLLTKNSYLPGVLVLHHTLQAVNSKYPLVVMVIPTLPHESREIVKKRGMVVREIDSLHPQSTHGIAEHDARFGDTWTKLRGFEITEYDRIVLIDCDMIIKRNMDDLFDIELPKDHIAAAHVCACNPLKLTHYPDDWVPANCAYTKLANSTSPPPVPTESTPRPYSQLNSGTVVLNPSKNLAKAIIDFLQTSDLVAGFKFPDQDLLTVVFAGKWKPLPWYYNALRTLSYVHTNIWDDNEIRCLHYILAEKPWRSRVKGAPKFRIVDKWWWDAFDVLIERMKIEDPEGQAIVLSHVDYF